MEASNILDLDQIKLENPLTPYMASHKVSLINLAVKVGFQCPYMVSTLR